MQTAKTGQTRQMCRLIWVFAGRTSICWFCHAVAHLCWRKCDNICLVNIAKTNHSENWRRLLYFKIVVFRSTAQARCTLLELIECYNRGWKELPNEVTRFYLDIMMDIITDWTWRTLTFSQYSAIWASSWDYGTFRRPYTHSSNAHAQPYSGARCLDFWSEPSSTSILHTCKQRRLCAFSGRLCDKYPNLMSWLI